MAVEHCEDIVVLERAARPRRRASCRNVERCLGNRIERQFGERGALDRHGSCQFISFSNTGCSGGTAGPRPRSLPATCREQRMINLEIVFGHAGGGKSFLETSADRTTIERQHLRQHPDRLLHRVDDHAGDPFVDDLGHRAATKGEHRRAAGHRLDHRQSERLRPVDREQQRSRLAQKFALRTFVDLADILHARLIEQRRDLLAEISFVDLVDLGSDLDRDSESARDPDRAIGPLLGRDAAEKGDVPAAWTIGGLEQVERKAVMHRGDEIGVGDRLALRVRDRHQRHIVEADVERLEVGKVLPPVKVVVTVRCAIGRNSGKWNWSIWKCRMSNSSAYRRTRSSISM